MITRTPEEITKHLIDLQDTVKSIRDLHSFSGEMTIEVDAQIIEQLQAELDKAKAELVSQIDLCEGLCHDNTIFATENERLKMFGRVVIKVKCWNDLGTASDKFNIQEWAEATGLIFLHTKAGNSWYEFSDWMKENKPNTKHWTK